MNPGGLAAMTAALCVSTVLAFTTGPRSPVLLAYNATESAAVGFYAVQPAAEPNVGDQVLSRLPPPIEELADHRRYVPAGTPVLKTVAARAGAAVCRVGAVVTINGHVVVLARSSDRGGRWLPVWGGCQRLSAAEAFLLGRHRDSFDGRYFGPTDRSLILGKAIPLWTW
jgi:type IV secretory pathway protease TraF